MVIERKMLVLYIWSDHKWDRDMPAVLVCDSLPANLTNGLQMMIRCYYQLVQMVLQDYHQLAIILIPMTLLCQPKLLFMV